jgi:glycosyltransferase involved in cell wall biosynthesis
MNINKDCFVTVHQGSAPPEMSVVMPIYNCEEFVELAVTSILEQQNVVVEILISDDASTDNTFSVAYKTVMDYINKSDLPHTVVMRAGSTRLKRDHLHLLADQAVCDLICQAHGDDISHPLRCSTLVKAFNQENVNVSMIFVNGFTIDQHGQLVQKPKNQSFSNIPMIPLEYNHIISANNEILIGSNMAWRRSALVDFPQLTTANCAYGHDRVMAFRSFLTGVCYLLDAPLIKRRIHENNLHKELLSSKNKLIRTFNTQLIRLSLFSTMKNDLQFLKENNQIDETKFVSISNDINGITLLMTKLLTTSMNELVSTGHVHHWNDAGAG